MSTETRVETLSENTQPTLIKGTPPPRNVSSVPAADVGCGSEGNVPGVSHKPMDIDTKSPQPLKRSGALASLDDYTPPRTRSKTSKEQNSPSSPSQVQVANTVPGSAVVPIDVDQIADPAAHTPGQTPAPPAAVDQAPAAAPEAPEAAQRAASRAPRGRRGRARRATPEREGEHNGAPIPQAPPAQEPLAPNLFNLQVPGHARRVTMTIMFYRN